MSSLPVVEPVVEPMDIEVPLEEVRHSSLCVCVQCIMCEVLVYIKCYLLVFIVVIQGEMLPDTDVFWDVVISNVSV